MGCGGSTNGEKGQNAEDGQKKGSFAQRQPKISIKVGKEVKMLDKHPRVIFVFGECFNCHAFVLFQIDLTLISSISLL